MADRIVIWGYALEGPGRPSRFRQAEILAMHGVDIGEFGTLWSDKIARGKRGPLGGVEQLVVRNDLLRAIKPGDRVVVTDAYCLGIGESDVSQFVGALAERGVSLLISGDSYSIAPGDDASDLIAEVARRQNAANVAACRARQAKQKSK